MKTIADLTVRQLNSLAHIAMLRLDTHVLFMAGSPKEVFKNTLDTVLTPYEMRVLLKLLPDLIIGNDPVIKENDEPGVQLVKATWLGIRSMGLHPFFATASTHGGLGSYKKTYLLDSLCAGDRESDTVIALSTYIRLIEDLYSYECGTVSRSSKIFKVKQPRIGDYWNNLVATRHLFKDPAKWAAHVEKNTAA